MDPFESAAVRKAMGIKLNRKKKGGRRAYTRRPKQTVATCFAKHGSLRPFSTTKNGDRIPKKSITLMGVQFKRVIHKGERARINAAKKKAGTFKPFPFATPKTRGQANLADLTYVEDVFDNGMPLELGPRITQMTKAELQKAIAQKLASRNGVVALSSPGRPIGRTLNYSTNPIRSSKAEKMRGMFI